MQSSFSVYIIHVSENFEDVLHPNSILYSSSEKSKGIHLCNQNILSIRIIESFIRSIIVQINIFTRYEIKIFRTVFLSTQ